LSRRQNAELGDIRAKTLVEPCKGGAKEKVAATDTAVIYEIKRGPALDDSGDGGGFDSVRKVGVQDFVVEELKNERESGVRESFDKPFFPAVRPRGWSGIPFTQKGP